MHFKSVHQPIPSRENREHPGNFQNKSVSFAFNWVLSVYYDYVQGFHKLEINSFSSSSFSCTFMWGKIDLWFELFSERVQIRGVLTTSSPSVLFSQKFISTLLSVFWLLTTECKNPSKLKCRQVASFALAALDLVCSSLFSTARRQPSWMFSTGLSTDTSAYRTNLWIHTRILEKDFLVTELWKDVECNYEFLY